MDDIPVYNCRFILIVPFIQELPYFLSNGIEIEGIKPINIYRSYIYSLFFVGTVCKRRFMIIFAAITRHQYGKDICSKQLEKPVLS